MGSSLRDIPGAGGGKRRRAGLGRVGGGPASKPWQPPPRVSTTRAVPRRPGGGLRFQAPRFQVDRFNLLLGLAFVGLFLVGGIWLLGTNTVSVHSVGLEDGDAVTTDRSGGLEIELRVEPTDRLDSATVSFDGSDVTGDVESTDTGFLWTAPEEGLEEGTYELAVEVPRTVFGTARWSMTFGVDDTPPVVEVPTPEGVGIGEELTVAGVVDEPVELTVEGEPVEVDEDGAFAVTFAAPPAGAIDFAATDRAGNVGTLVVPVAVQPPSSRGLYLSATAWVDDGLRDGALALVDAGQVDTVVLDLKDECGVVPHASDVDLATQVGAVDEQYDLAEAVEAVHDRGGRVIGRLVVFRDPLLARWAWANGHADWVLQDTANDPWPVYGDGEGCPEATNADPIIGGFTNIASEAVGDYNTALAVEAAAVGVDNVLLDDVRRPDGDLTYLQAVGIEGSIVETLTGFLGEAQRQVRAQGSYLGATTTGISVRDPSVYDQDLAAMGAVVDYLAPEVYPESYSAGFFNLADPESAPGETVQGALTEARAQLGDLATPLVPWLQDYSSGITYGAAEVQAQVDGAAAAGSCSWIVRDLEFTYTPGITPAC